MAADPALAANRPASGISGTNVLRRPGLGAAVDGQSAYKKSLRTCEGQILRVRCCASETRKSIEHAEV